MSVFLTALGGLITAAGVGMVTAARTWPAPGRHRRAAVLDESLMDELLGDWPEPVYAAAVTQAWRWCPSCCRNEPSVLHQDGTWTCGHCLETTTTSWGDK
jgi:ribosomal protein S27AE